MSEDRTWTLDEANAALPRVREVVERAKDRQEQAKALASSSAARARSNGHGLDVQAVREVNAAVAELAAEGIVLRDVERGLVDFPARSPSGRPYWLCWVLGEPEVAWWHWIETGFAGRTPLTDPPP